MGLLDFTDNARMRRSQAPWAEPALDLSRLQRQRNQEMQARAKETWETSDNPINKAQRTAALASLARMAGRAYTPPQLADPNDQPRQTLRQPLDDNGYASMSSAGDREFLRKHGGVNVWDTPDMSHSEQEKLFRGAGIEQSYGTSRMGYRAGQNRAQYDLHEDTGVTAEEAGRQIALAVGRRALRYIREEFAAKRK